MKTFILLVGISLAIASPSVGGNVGKSKHEKYVANAENKYVEFLPETPETVKPEPDFVIPEKQYPEVITEFVESIDYSQVPIEELLQIASEQPGLEFLSDANATAAMGIDINNLDPDLVADALATTVG